eukprot:Clim_evm9s211 gene=Clim_evmTU9s211
MAPYNGELIMPQPVKAVSTVPCNYNKSSELAAQAEILAILSRKNTSAPGYSSQMSVAFSPVPQHRVASAMDLPMRSKNPMCLDRHFNNCSVDPAMV